MSIVSTGRGTGQALYDVARRIIPGGTQLLSKRPELFLPSQWPAYYTRAKGVETWDMDGRRYVDFTHFGVGACVLGFADDDVEQAVVAAIRDGSMCTLNAPEEVELAEVLCELHPWAEMARFGRCGGEAMAIAVRVARAATGRDEVAFCGYHGWNDWYLAANLASADSLAPHLLAGLSPAGVPQSLSGTVHPFHYNRGDELEAIVAARGRRLAAIVMEPARNEGPAAGFLASVRRLAERCGAVLVFDEVTSAWRMNSGGIHLTYDVVPDVAVFAKAMGGGYPIAAVIGTRSVMETAQTTFISSTFWTERIGPVAALATIRKHRALNVGTHLIDIGSAVQSGWKRAAERSGLPVVVSGIPPLSHLEFATPSAAAVATLFTQEMLDRGYLAGTSFYPSYAHQSQHVIDYLAHVEEVFNLLGRAVASESVESRLRGPVKHSGFQRLN